MKNAKQNSLFSEGIDFPFQTAHINTEDSPENFCDDDIDYVTKAAQDAFGITYLFPWQRIVIANILDASSWKKQSFSSDLREEPPKNQIVLLPTGAGKSLCFLTPALILPGATLVLYPLLALMADQKRRIDEGGLESVIFRGGQTLEEREENFKQIKNGARIILANPEVLQNKNLITRLKECNISHIAIDEAHCVSEWGDSFRPAYLTLGKIIKELDVPVVTAFTATASPEVLKRVSEVLFGGEAHIVRSESDRPNIHYNVINSYAKKREVFKTAIKSKKPLIIFCGTRNASEDMARELSAYYGSEKVKFYHAGLEKKEKDTVEKWFHKADDAILCCTCAYGMGVDKKNVRTVLHYAVSPTVEAYIQEAGRGGRDGEVSNAILFWSPKDRRTLTKFPLEARERKMALFAESSNCRRQVLLNALGGEEVYCDGCDVCKRGGKAPFAEDALFIIDIVKKNRKLLNREQLESLCVKELNKKDIKEFGCNIWEENDVKEIIENLLKEGYLRECLWPLQKKFDCALTLKHKEKLVPKVYRSKKYKRILFIQKKILRHLNFQRILKKLLERVQETLSLQAWYVRAEASFYSGQHNLQEQ